MALEWDLLPVIILTHVFSYLNPRDRVVVSEVCSHWREALGCPTIWRRMLVQLDRDLMQTPDPKLNLSEPVLIHLAQLFGHHMHRLELAWSRPPGHTALMCPLYGLYQTHAEAGAAYLILLRRSKVQLRELILTDWVFSYKWRKRNKLLFVLTNFLITQNKLNVLSLENACFGVGEVLQLVNAAMHLSSGCLHQLDLRSAFRDFQPPGECPAFLQMFQQLKSITVLTVDYSTLSDEALVALANSDCKSMKRLRITVRDTDYRHHTLANSAWLVLVAACPNLHVALCIVNLSHYEDLCYLLMPNIPLDDFQLYSGFLWDQRRSRNFRSTLSVLLNNYAYTLENIELHLKYNTEDLDDLLLQLLSQCTHLSNFQFDGIIRSLETIRRICAFQLNSSIRFKTIHVRPKIIGNDHCEEVKQIYNDYADKLAEKSIDFKMEDPSSIIMFC